MKSVASESFGLAPGLVLLNHASYGVTSRRVMAEGDRIRQHIESDPTRLLGAELTEKLRTQTKSVATAVGLDPTHSTLCTNATSGAAAIIGSVPLVEGDTVVVFETEYSSVRRAWEVACARVGARMVVAAVPVPLHGAEQVLAELDELVPDAVTYVQISLISSSTAILFPIAEVAEWARERGGRVILDVAHGPGHVPLTPEEWGVAAMFGTVHKWLPTLRPVGILWADGEFVARIRPAEVSLTWDSADLVERFSWPGTFDPVARLSLDTAVAQWDEWRDKGMLTECAALADTASAVLEDLGARPTAGAGYRPPRLRAFTLPGASVMRTKELLRQAMVRAWVGAGAGGECLLRVSTHVYNDRRDVDTVARVIEEVLTR